MLLLKVEKQEVYYEFKCPFKKHLEVLQEEAHVSLESTSKIQINTFKLICQTLMEFFLLIENTFSYFKKIPQQTLNTNQMAND